MPPAGVHRLPRPLHEASPPNQVSVVRANVRVSVIFNADGAMSVIRTVRLPSLAIRLSRALRRRGSPPLARAEHRRQGHGQTLRELRPPFLLSLPIYRTPTKLALGRRPLWLALLVMLVVFATGAMKTTLRPKVGPQLRRLIVHASLFSPHRGRRPPLSFLSLP